jgi:glycosyltransferase involved in cell wall biosynthesis
LTPLTVVVTSYNRAKYVGLALESILNSTFGNFEVLVLDDASTDGTAAVARSLAALDRRIRVVVNEKNLGQFANRNRALELVGTPYLKYHDSDDLMYPHCLETMMRLLEAEPRAGFALSAGWAWPGGPCPMLSTPRMSYQREFLGQGMFYCGPAGALFRTEVLKRLGGFPERGVASDFCFWLKACASTPVLLLPADLFWYRRHPSQELSSGKAARDYALAQGESWRALHAKDCPLEGNELARAKRSCLYRLLRSSYRDVKARRFALARLRLSSAGIRLSDWVRYPPRQSQDPNAGSPVGTDGEFLAPSWVRTGAAVHD